MRVFVLMLSAALALGACGPSSANIHAAKTAQYTAAPNQLLDVALQVAQRNYKIGPIAIQKGQLATDSQWYNKEGGRISAYNDGRGDFINAGGGDVQVTLVVAVRKVEGGNVMVQVTPKTFQLVAGSPKPRELTPEDPNLPPWVLGRADALTVAIHDEAKRLFPTQ